MDKISLEMVNAAFNALSNFSKDPPKYFTAVVSREAVQNLKQFPEKIEFDEFGDPCFYKGEPECEPCYIVTTRSLGADSANKKV